MRRMYGLWVRRQGADEKEGFWHMQGDGVFLAPSAAEALKVLENGYDNAFSYTAKEFDGVLPVRRVEPPPPARMAPRRPDLPAVVRVRFRTDYTLEHGIKDAQPGDAFFVPHARDEQGAFHCDCWDNCDGQHLYVVCPDGRWWNVDGRAGNCTEKAERTHRCWVRTGDPAAGTLHVDKAGKTCAAGAGSIDTGTYHGHLVHGELRKC